MELNALEIIKLNQHNYHCDNKENPYISRNFHCHRGSCCKDCPPDYCIQGGICMSVLCLTRTELNPTEFIINLKKENDPNTVNLLNAVDALLVMAKLGNW